MLTSFKMELDYVQMDGNKGTLIINNDGLFFHQYDMSKRPPYLMGESLAISSAGIFGAINLHKKLSAIKNLPDIAKDIRKEKSIEELVKGNEMTYIPWHEVGGVKKNWLSGSLTMRTKSGKKIKMRVTETKKEKEITSFLEGKISSN